MSIASLFQDTQTRTLRIKKYRFTSYPRSGFESLARIRKFMIVRNSSPRFALFYNRLLLAFDLLFWNNDGTRMTRKAHKFYLRTVVLENGLVTPNKIVVNGIPIDVGQIRQDVYAVGTQQDHIVPWKAAWRITQLAGGKVHFVLGSSGHIAGIATPPAKGKGYWTNDTPAKTADE